ncbi:MAG: hypothetical protein DMF53_00675 [Acidobacteria bacterium]|nr:MAG: hypothetical protein DMF53_00675 [Acidobacteriota bacterium]
MPIKNARADVFRDWESVLGAVTENAAMVPGVDPFKSELEGFLAQARDLKVQQETLDGQRMGITQKLDKVIENGRESARKVRGYARIHLGSDNKALKQFGVAPRVRRGSKKAKPPETPPPTVTPSSGGTAQSPAHNQTESTPGKEGTHA